MRSELLKKVLRVLTRGPRPVVIVSLLLLLSLYLMSSATENSARFDEQYLALLIINAVGLIMLVLLIGASGWRLVQQYRNAVPGARLTVRLLRMFVIIAVIPVSVVYYFSLGFLHRGIDSWFDVQIEQALNDAIELSRTSLDARMRDLLRQSKAMAVELAYVSDEAVALTLDDFRNRSGANEVTVFEGNNVIASSSALALGVFNPARLDESIVSVIREGNSYVGLDPIADAGLYMRIVVQIPSVGTGFGVRMLQGLYPVAERQNELADSVQQAFAKYNELVFLRKPLKYSFTLTLSLVLLLTVLGAVWAAFYSARRLVSPISDLAEGTRAVAGGDYSKRLPLPANDELGFLVQSFNQMTRRIERARNDVQQSQQLAEEQRAYLEVVLGSLTSGVLTIDHDGVLRTVNEAAAQILGISADSILGLTLSDIASAQPRLRYFVDVITERLGSNTEWQEEVVMFGPAGRQVLMCRGTHLPGHEQQQGDALIVFDDVTALIQAQRDAAWGEVARRLAHEIKNPLTPIQLSAERLRHKYLGKLNEKDGELLDRSTHTIVQQVETMKEMVNAFTEYARAPQVELVELDLNSLIEEVVDLYRAGEQAPQISLELSPEMPRVEADDGRLRQLMHNLIKNAVEAAEQTGQTAQIAITTRCMQEASCRFVEIRVSDNGPGIAEEMMSTLFEPYVTSKQKGTGLGLAIVKKIVEEHGGMIQAQNNEQGGATIIIRLPVVHAGEAAQSAAGD
ncbi:MAG: ATP-binding protein [Granulosicoccaceae bacterium]|jgi:PAS domain S-box-containing protein